MHNTSDTYKALLAKETHRKETKLSIAGIEYGQDMLVSIKRSGKIFSKNNPMVGCCVAGEVKIETKLPSEAIPRCAELRPYVRLTDGTNVSEWLPKGVYYVDTRPVDASSRTKWITLNGFDAMMKAEAPFPSVSDGWPEGGRTDIAVVRIIAAEMGVEVDPRTVAIMNQGYKIPLPLGYSMRETLGYLAAAYAGNFVMSDEGKLLLIQLNSIPRETSYLVVSYSNPSPITFGGVRILV